MEKKLTNNGPLKESADKHSIYTLQLWVDGQEVTQLSGVQPYHLLVCDALGLDSSWYEASLAQKKRQEHSDPLNVGLIAVLTHFD